MTQFSDANRQNPYICSFCGFNNTSYLPDFQPHFGGESRRRQAANQPYAAQVKSYKCQRCGNVNRIE